MKQKKYGLRGLIIGIVIWLILLLYIFVRNVQYGVSEALEGVGWVAGPYVFLIPLGLLIGWTIGKLIKSGLVKE